MDFGIANGLYLVAKSGLVQGVQTGFNTGLANGMYNDTLIKDAIVRDGLIFYIDAAIRPSYIGSGTVWRDLTQNGYNGTLTNTPTFDSSNNGSLVFNGANYADNFGANSSFSFIQNTGIYTISAWVKPSVLNAEMYFSGNNSGSTINKGFFIGIAPTTFNLVLLITRGQAGQTVLSHSVSNFFSNTSDWINVVAVGNGIANQFYRNGNNFGNSSNFSIFSAGDSTNALGVGFIKSLTSSFLWRGRIANVQIYNRDLSRTEVNQNYQAQKYRFGL